MVFTKSTTMNTVYFLQTYIDNKYTAISLLGRVSRHTQSFWRVSLFYPDFTLTGFDIWRQRGAKPSGQPKVRDLPRRGLRNFPSLSCRGKNQSHDYLLSMASLESMSARLLRSRGIHSSSTLMPSISFQASCAKARRCGRFIFHCLDTWLTTSLLSP